VEVEQTLKDNSPAVYRSTFDRSVLGSRPKAGMVKMHIDSYQFGEIVIDGINYSSDLIILGDTIQSEWWRKEGHSLAVEDIKSVIAAGPAVLIVGCGASGLMKVAEDTRKALNEHGIQLEVLDTKQAVSRFNELSKKGVNVAAALHLTC